MGEEEASVAALLPKSPSSPGFLPSTRLPNGLLMSNLLLDVNRRRQQRLIRGSDTEASLRKRQYARTHART